MLQLIPYEPDHIKQLALHKGTMHLINPAFEMGYFEALKGPYSFTAIGENGRLIGCGGIFEYWPNRGEVWAMLDASCKRDFIEIDRAVRRMLDVAPYRRLEAIVDVGFEQGHRWCKLLGFELEAPLMRHYHPGHGGDVSLYARVS